MALIWCDGFNHYGSSVSNMLDGTWAEIYDASSLYFSLSTTQARTGTYALKRGSSQVNGDVVARRVLGGAKTTVGVGFAFYYSILPDVNDISTLLEFRDADNKPNVMIILQSTGDLAIYRGDTYSGTKLAQTTSPPVIAGGFQHLEVMATLDSSVGAVEIRINGVTVLTITGTDTVAAASEIYGFSTDANAQCSQIALSGRDPWRPSSTPDNGFEIYYSDIYAYDDDGLFNNSWQGDRRVFTLYPNVDTAQADWTPTTVNGYDALNAPLDDADYISTGAPGSPDETSSEFGFDALPKTTGLVTGVSLVNRAKKTEAGSADLKAAILSDSNETEGAVHPLNTVFTYHEDVFQYDPATGAAFTTDAVDALEFRVSRIT